VYGQAILNNKLQYLSKFPIWISQDMESGAAMRVNGTTRFSPAMGIAATGNPINAYQKGQITAREARALGVHQVYAPVLDVNNNPENPVINVRSYASDPNVCF
jgi:beta-N-acetylhexosaminidase